MALNPGTGIRRGRFEDRLTYTEGRQTLDDGGRDWRAVTTSQGLLPAAPEAKRKSWNRSFLRAFREHGLSNTLTSEFQPSEV